MALNRFVFFASMFLVAWAVVLWGNELGPVADRSGVSGATCSISGCHFDLPFPNLGGGNVRISGLPSEWSPGITYPLDVIVTHSGAVRFGFQMTAVDSNSAQAGAFTAPIGMKVDTESVGGNLLQHIEHSFPKTGNGSATFSFDWTAPSSSATGDVRFNVAANGANGDFTKNGDFIYSDQQIVSAATTTTTSETFYFPQIADGTFTGAFFTTTIFVSNPASSGSANITITFTNSAGDPFNLSFIDSNSQPIGSGNVVTISSLAGGQSRKIVSTAASAIAVGYATVTSDAPITATAVFSQFLGTPGSGTLLSEAAVTSSATATDQDIFIDESFGFRTGLAVANPSLTSPASLTFSLHRLDTDGTPVLTTTRSLNEGQHTSLFVDELFANDPLAVGLVGTMRIQSDTPVAIVALRFLGSLFTSVPFSSASLGLPLDRASIRAWNWLNHRQSQSLAESRVRFLSPPELPPV